MGKDITKWGTWVRDLDSESAVWDNPTAGAWTYGPAEYNSQVENWMTKMGGTPNLRDTRQN